MKTIFKFLDLTIVVLAFGYALWLKKGSPAIILPTTLFLGGLAVWIVGRKELGKNFSVTPKAIAITKTGIYRKIRHPIYVGSSIATLMFCVIYDQLWTWLLWLGLIIVQISRAKAEENLLYKTFGQDYLSYKNSTWF